MTDDEALSAQLRAMMRKARRALDVAEELRRAHHYPDAAAKAYYAVFHALEAVLLTAGLSYSKHAGVIAVFNREFVRKGVFPKAFSKHVTRLYEDRQTGDYSYEDRIDAATARRDVDNAREVVNGVGDYLKRGGFLDG